MDLSELPWPISSELLLLQHWLPKLPESVHGWLLKAHFLDSTAFYLLCISCLFLALAPLNKRPAIGLFALGVALNYWLKQCFGWPRPFIVDESLLLNSAAMVHSPLGMPSGAAQNSVILGYLLHKAVQRSLIIPWLVLYWLLIGASRVLLGVHFMSDVLVGSVVGLGLIAGFPLIKTIIQKIDEWPNTLRWGIASGLIGIGLFFSPAIGYQYCLGVWAFILLPWPFVSTMQSPFNPKSWVLFMSFGALLALVTFKSLMTIGTPIIVLAFLSATVLVLYQRTWFKC